MKESIRNLKEGEVYKEKFSYTQDDVNKFAEISRDKNPIHLDEEYASKTIFGRRIIHGYLSTSIFSKVFATNFPGEGTIYLKQDLKFLKPMFVGEVYVAVFKVENIIKDRSRALVTTEIFDSKENLVVTGEALIQNNKLI